jgi:hypothetical protein
MSSAIPARLTYQCGHAALVTLPRIKGETAAQRNERVSAEKSAALARPCDFCGPAVEVAKPQLVEEVIGTHLTAAEVLAAEPVAEATPEPDQQPVIAIQPVLVTQPDTYLNGATGTSANGNGTASDSSESDERRSASRSARARRRTSVDTPLVERNRRYRFVVRYEAQQVFTAGSIRDALTKAASLGELLSLTREG